MLRITVSVGAGDLEMLAVSFESMSLRGRVPSLRARVDLAPSAMPAFPFSSPSPSPPFSLSSLRLILLVVCRSIGRLLVWGGGCEVVDWG